MPKPDVRFLLAFALSGAMAGAQGTTTTHPQQPVRPVEAVVPSARAAAAAARIDVLLAKGQRTLQVEAMPIADDATFLRRAFLATVGRIPNLAEAQAFLADTDADKRARLIDRLLDSPGHTSHDANFWFDLLRVKSRLRQTSGEPFAEWIRTAIANDLPYDEFVRQMLTAEGAASERGHGATGYLLRDANMPHDAMANTLRLFLGTRLECAQCHDHPFDTWKQKEFYGMAAFFGGLRYRLDGQNAPAGLQGARQIVAQLDERQRQIARNQLQRLASGISGSGTGVERLPDDYKYDDARPKQAVYADTLFGKDVKLPRPGGDTGADRRPRPRAAAQRRDAEVGSREALAQWLTSPDTPRFATVIVNRMWQRTFGRGLIEPVDDLKADSKAVFPELQRHLEQLLVELKFDLRQFQRVLLRTQLFQRECPPGDAPAELPYAFAGPLLRRMTAEQTWDSLLTLVFADLDQRLRPADARAAELYERYDQVANADAEQLKALLTDPGRRAATPAQPALQQQAERLRSLTPEQQRQVRTLTRQLLEARRAGDPAKVRELAGRFEELGLAVPGERAARGREGDLLRASDLVQPAPAGHLLRQFGQSDRESFDGANTAANVPQVLTMLNGFLDQRVLSGQSALRADLESVRDPQRRIEIAFLAVLSRMPTGDEAALWRSALASDGDAGLRDLVWVLCNSNEFRFIR